MLRYLTRRGIKDFIIKNSSSRYHNDIIHSLQKIDRNFSMIHRINSKTNIFDALKQNNKWMIRNINQLPQHNISTLSTLLNTWQTHKKKRWYTNESKVLLNGMRAYKSQLIAGQRRSFHSQNNNNNNNPNNKSIFTQQKRHLFYKPRHEQHMITPKENKKVELKRKQDIPEEQSHAVDQNHIKDLQTKKLENEISNLEMQIQQINNDNEKIATYLTNQANLASNYSNNNHPDYNNDYNNNNDYNDNNDEKNTYNQRSTGGNDGSEKKPLFVQLKDGESWPKLIRSIFLTFIILSLLAAWLEDRQANGGGVGGGILGGFTQSPVHKAEKSDKLFDDVAGVEEAKQELVEIIEYLKDPYKFNRLGGKLARGILLVGPPGTGKTLLAKAVAGEADVPFFFASGAEFEEIYVGMGAKRVRELFQTAKKESPCIVFIDEFDAVGGRRSLKDHQSLRQTLNQLLVEMDGFEEQDGIIVIAATNFPQVLDPALLRPGRFDRQVNLPLPDINGREAILELYGENVPLSKEVDLNLVARSTPGFSGADLSNLINQSAVIASVKDKKLIELDDIEEARDKIIMGSERKSAYITKETATLTAYHESGHALVAIKSSAADPVYKATIMPRGRALGMVTQLPEGDQTGNTKEELLARLDVCMGGRVAEEIKFGKNKVTTGASSDFQQATKIARLMVYKLGMYDDIGLTYLEEDDPISPEQKAKLDAKVNEILNESYERAKKIIQTNSRSLERLAKALLEYETLNLDEIKTVIDGERLRRKKVIPVYQRNNPKERKKRFTELREKRKQNRIVKSIELVDQRNEKK